LSFYKSAIGFQDLSKELQKEVQELQRRMAQELQPLVLESTLTMQKILVAEDHTARVKLLRFFIEAEAKRLTTKKALIGMFNGSSSSVADDIPPEERVTDDAVARLDQMLNTPPPSFLDDDAFQ
jgi:hypothetical protein